MHSSWVTIYIRVRWLQYNSSNIIKHHHEEYSWDRHHQSTELIRERLKRFRFSCDGIYSFHLGIFSFKLGTQLFLERQGGFHLLYYLFLSRIRHTCRTLYWYRWFFIMLQLKYLNNLLFWKSKEQKAQEPSPLCEGLIKNHGSYCWLRH